MKLHPVSEQNATGTTKAVFEDVKQVLHVSYIPLLFQYLAVSENYLSFIWQRIGRNVNSPQFQEKHEKIIGFCERAIGKIYPLTPEILTYIDTFSEEEKKKLANTISELVSLNATLLLISFSLRESIKGIPLEQMRLEEGKRFEHTYENQDQQTRVLSGQDNQIGMSSMLVPFFGNQSLETLPYAQFFSIVNQEVEKLYVKESYLTTRVGLEQIAQLSITTFPYPMNSSFRELAQMIPDRELLYELLSVLKHMFPPQFPHLLLTSIVMDRLLSNSDTSLTNIS